MTPKDKNIPQTLREFRSNSPSTSERKPKCFAEQLSPLPECSAEHLGFLSPALGENEQNSQRVWEYSYLVESSRISLYY